MKKKFKRSETTPVGISTSMLWLPMDSFRKAAIFFLITNETQPALFSAT
jgi:hypothetical protein